MLGSIDFGALLLVHGSMSIVGVTASASLGRTFRTLSSGALAV
jgi:hypothetical protein